MNKGDIVFWSYAGSIMLVIIGGASMGYGIFPGAGYIILGVLAMHWMSVANWRKRVESMLQKQSAELKEIKNQLNELNNRNTEQ